MSRSPLAWPLLASLLLLVVRTPLASGYTLTVNSGTGSGSYSEGTVVSISANTPLAGMQFNLWACDWGKLANREGSITNFTMPGKDAIVTATYRKTGSPIDWWPWFNGFCNQFFGAEREPLAYDMHGNDLVFMSRTGSEWRHVSKNSASIAWETNLPAKTYVEYCTTTGYGSQTPQTDRYHYLHLHYMTNLLQNSLYHYRYVAQDERGNTIYSPDKTLTTSTPLNVVYIPSGVGGPPYNLTQSNKTYLVTEDLVCNRTAFNVNASNITIDLGGHTVVYNEEDYQVTSNYTSNSAFGVKIFNYNDVNVVNGTIKQGAGANHSDIDGIGYNPFYSYHGYGDIAGVTIDYIGSQLTGICMNYTTGYDIHHNVILDRGGDIADRQSALHGIRQSLSIHHNLLKRVRHCGISACDNGETYANEIYVDSCDTNSFGIVHYKTVDAECHDNRIFGQGYLAVGIGTVSAGVSDIDIHDNYVHLQACEPDDRSTEYGSQSGAYCTRVTWGGDNINYHDNVLVTYGQDGGMVRGVWACPEPGIVDVIWQDNIIKAVLDNTASAIQGAIVIAGDSSSSDAPMTFKNNRVISNFVNVKLGESYGTGCNTEYYDNTFVKGGPARGDYRTINCGYGSKTTTGHQFYDSLFEGGASYDEYQFDGAGARDFYIGWTLTIQTDPLADITIRDAFNSTVYTGQSDGSGLASTRLYQYKQEYNGRTHYTPHDVTVTKGVDSKTVSLDVDDKKTVELWLNGWPLTVTNGSGSGVYATDEVVPISANTPASGKLFAVWVGDIGYVDDRTQASTTVTMPAGDVAVTAAYVWGYQLTVNSGTGDGLYFAGSVVDIVADEAPSGTAFDVWTGDTEGIADAELPTTTITMSSSHTEIAASYESMAIPGDLNDDGWVGQPDLDIILDDWGNDPPSDPRADPSGDGWVGQPDLDIVLDHWGDSI